MKNRINAKTQRRKVTKAQRLNFFFAVFALKDF
jgi:hypothetical protein